MHTGPFAAVEECFAVLSAAGVLAVDPAALGWPPRDAVPLTRLRSALLRRSVGHEDRDRALDVVLAKAQAQPDPWMLGLAGMLLPGLRAAHRDIVSHHPVLRDRYAVLAEIQHDLLAALMHAASVRPAGVPRVAYELVQAAARSARVLARQEATAVTRAALDDLDVTVDAARVVGWDEATTPPGVPTPREVLNEAVAAGVLQRDDALLIAATRLDGHTLRELAASLGIPYHALRQRRLRAENALRAWFDLVPVPSGRLIGGRPRRGNS